MSIVWYLQQEIFNSLEHMKKAKDIIQSYGDKTVRLYSASHMIKNNLEFPKIDTSVKHTGFITIQNANILQKHIDFHNYLDNSENNFIFYDNYNYNVSSWYNTLESNYLNYDCLFVPAWTLKNENFYGRYNTVIDSWTGCFSRSDSGNKKFTGLCTDDFYSLKYDLQKIDNNDIIVVAKKQEIFAEFRFYIVNKTISTYSQYGSYDKIRCPDLMIEYVNQVIEDISMDNFTIDSCIYKSDFPDTDNYDFNSMLNYAIVEINALSTSGIYVDASLERLIEDIRNYIRSSKC